uniref:Uncharacterized protein n=1 Tax=Sus scrofa TaxID=9823 RepID=A0A8D1RMQ4_PIG
MVNFMAWRLYLNFWKRSPRGPLHLWPLKQKGGTHNEVPPHPPEGPSSKSLQTVRAGCEEKETSLHRWWDYKLVQPLWKTVWRFLRKLKIELPFDPAVPLLGIYPEKAMA